MRELSQLLFKFEAPFRTLFLGLLVGCGLGLKAHPEALSSISLRAESMHTRLLTLPAASFGSQMQARESGANIVHPSATVRMEALSTQSTELCVYPAESTFSSIFNLAALNPSFYLRVRCQPPITPSVNLNYRNSTLFCYKDLSGSSKSGTQPPDSSHIANECQLRNNTSVQTSIGDLSGFSFSNIVVVFPVIAFGLSASLPGYFFGKIISSGIKNTISASRVGILSLIKLLCDLVSDPLFFVIIGSVAVVEAYKSLLHFASNSDGTPHGYSRFPMTFAVQWVLVSLVLGSRWMQYAFMLGLDEVLNATRPLLNPLGIKHVSLSMRHSTYEYLVDLVGCKLWTTFINSRVVRFLVQVVDISCIVSDHIQAIFDLAAQVIVSTLLLCADAICYNCIFFLKISMLPLHGTLILLYSRIKYVRMGISDIAFELEYVFPLPFCISVLPLYLQETAGRYLETVIHVLFLVLLNGLLDVVVESFILLDGISQAYNFSDSASPGLIRRDSKIIDRLRKRGVLSRATSVTIRSSTPFSPRQFVDFENGLKNIRKYHALDYKFVAKIKRMGVGKVSVVEHRVTRKKLVLRTAALKGPDRKSLIAELRALVRVDGCNWFPLLLDGLVDGEELHVLTNFHPRGNLSDYVRSLGGCLDARLAKFYLAEMLIAIQAVHAYGIIHRRISTENLLLSDSGHLVLSNFSYCKVFDHNVDDETVHPQPKDPQSIEEAVNSGRIDYYRMALVYYQILTGRYLSFTAPLVHSPIEPREGHMQTLTAEDIQFLSRILDNFPANSPHVSKIRDSSLFNDIDWEAICHQAVSVPLTHRVLRAKSSRSSVHFERVDEGEGGSR